ncbi:MAG: tetratricopeptide repeat protein, partial [Bacteroidia bacterium]
MNKKFYTIGSFVALLLVCGFAYTKYASATEEKKEIAINKGNNVPELLDRKGLLANTLEWSKTKEQIESLRARLAQNPNDMDAKLQLAYAFMDEARITGEHPYYYPVALKLIDEVLKADEKNYFALAGKASVLLSQHKFAEAKEVATKAMNIDPEMYLIYGALCDANVELGDYAEAVKMADKMVSLKPELSSYARVSYLREIHGDINGAIDAMKMAVEAGYPGSEQTAWTRVTLGKLYESIGDLANAETHYLIALDQRPNYAFAVAGLGSVEKAKKNYTKSIEYYEKALVLVPEFSFQEDLTDLYEITGNNVKAKESAQTVLTMLQEDAESGHIADKEIANAALDAKDMEKALKHAQTEYKRRPKNINTNETLAWVLYNKGSYAEALPYIKESLRTNSKNPELRLKAGLIYAKSGDTKTGVKMIRESI